MITYRIVNIATGRELGRVQAKSERAAKVRAYKLGMGWDWAGLHNVYAV